MIKKQRAPNKHIPVDIKDFLEYNPQTGNIFWIRRPHNRSAVRPGDLSGNLSIDGYRQITFRRKIYKEHRIAWYLFYGEDIGNKTIDHINGIRNDNRISNLRVVLREQQSLNVGKLGYHWREDRKCFVSRCKNNRKMKNIGHSYCPLIARILYMDYHNEKYPDMKIENLIPRNSKIIGRPEYKFIR